MSQPPDSDAGSSSKRIRNRTISGLTVEQLERKRANDRRSQRASRARTRERIQLLERELENLRNIDPENVDGDENGAIQSLIRRNQQLEIELVRLRSVTGSGSMTTAHQQQHQQQPGAVLDPDLGTSGDGTGTGSTIAGAENHLASSMVHYSRPELPTSYLRSAPPMSTDMDNQLTAEGGSAETATAASFGSSVILNHSIHGFHPPQAGVEVYSPVDMPGPAPVPNETNANVVYLPQSQGYTTSNASAGTEHDNGAIDSNAVSLRANLTSSPHANDTLRSHHHNLHQHNHHHSNIVQYGHHDHHAYQGVDVLHGSGHHPRGGDCYDSTADGPWHMDDNGNETQ